MDRDELAKVIEEAEIAAGCFTVPAVRLAVADAIASWFREYLGREVEPLVRFHETGGHEGDGSDESVKRARAALTSIGGQNGGS